MSVYHWIVLHLSSDLENTEEISQANKLPLEAVLKKELIVAN